MLLPIPYEGEGGRRVEGGGFSTNPICPFLIPRIFHLLAPFLLQIACEFPVDLCTQYTNETCAPFAKVLTAVQIVALRMFSHVLLPWIRKL